jgi:phospholipid/cholesterol/gamma-HCH transport system ATP-binding protein
MKPATSESTSRHAKDVMVRVEGLLASYDGRVVLQDIDCEVRRGEVFVILGGSGSGKTTLLKHMIGLYQPAAGKVFVADRDLTAVEGNERREVLSRIGVMYQSGALFGSLDLIDNIRLPLEEYTDLPPDAMNRIAQMKLELVGLGEFGRHLPSEISGGMKRRAAIARAMALDPPILFLDEPSAGLDPITSAELDELIVRLSRDLGITFVIVSHELPSIFAIADRVIVLDKSVKTIVAEGDPADLRDHSEVPFVRQFFQRKAQQDPATAGSEDSHE